MLNIQLDTSVARQVFSRPPDSYAKALGQTIREVIQPHVLDTFEREGPGWAPIKPFTRKRRRMNQAGPILVETGLLKSMFEAPINQMITHRVLFISKFEAHYGTSLPHASVHQLGSDPGVLPVVPKRPFLTRPESDELNTMGRIFADFILDFVNRAIKDAQSHRMITIQLPKGQY